MRTSLLVALTLAAAVAAGCPTAAPPIDLGEGEGEGEGEEGEGEGEGEIRAAANDTCADPVVLVDGVEFAVGRFSATASRHSCSATNAAGDDGIEDIAFSFVLDAAASVVVTADGDDGSDSYASPTLTLFDNPLCAFPDPKVIDDRTCVGDGLTFDAATVMTVDDLPAGTWFLVAETFGDLSPFTIRVDVEN